MEMIKIGLLGYGNLGKCVEKAVCKQPDMKLTGIYSRRRLAHPRYKSIDALAEGEDIDVLILCGGSATDLPSQTPVYAKHHNVVDSFDHHQKIAAHYQQVDAAARNGDRLALISCGWDPGLFSIIRTLFKAVFPDSQIYTFWGKGISQGHSDAVRRIKGVKDARQYTIPLEYAMEKVRSGLANPEEMTAAKMHRRECYVVAEPGAGLTRIEREIKSMPDYFAAYDTEVHFITQEKLEREHCGFPHGGRVLGIGSGVSGEFQLDIFSNPEFTAGILVAYARAVCQMWKEGERGCRTVLEIPFSRLCSDMFIHM